MKSLRKVTGKLLVVLLISLTIFSCNKYAKYDDHEVIQNTFSGSVGVDDDSDPDGNYSGSGDNGVFSFAWVNTKTKASVKFDIDATSGSVQMILNDKNGKKIFDHTLTAGSGVNSYEGMTDEGKPGTWKVTLIFTNFDGNGSYEIDPKD